MISPTLNSARWPAARIALVVFVGLVGIYLLGRWDAGLSAREREHQERVQEVLKVGRALHRSMDSLKAVGDSLAHVDSLFANSEKRELLLLGRLAAMDTRESDSVESTSLDDLLPPLRLRALRESGSGAVVFATDSAGVRFLAGRLLLLGQADRRNRVLADLAAARASRITALGGQLGAALLRARQAETQIPVLERLLADSERLRRRKGKFLGFLPKPPPALTFLGGALACYLLCPKPS